MNNACSLTYSLGTHSHKKEVEELKQLVAEQKKETKDMKVHNQLLSTALATIL